MTSKLRNCLFCETEFQSSKRNVRASKTKEHVYAKWIRQRTTNNSLTMYQTRGDDPPIKLRQLSLEQFVNSNVCKECNNGWMEELETKTDLIVKRLFSGEDIRSFSETDIEALARWTAKTAAVLSFATPQKKHVPIRICNSLNPENRKTPEFRFFYAQVNANRRIEGAHIQIEYGAELPIIGSSEVTGTRILFCLNNHAFIADFPPILVGTIYDLSKSIAAQFWPTRKPAGTLNLELPLPASDGQVLFAVVNSIEAGYDASTLHV